MATESSVAYTTMIRDLPRGERPRERLREHGPSHLSNAELIAILLRTGVAGENVVNLAVRLLSQFQGLNGIARATYSEICSLEGHQRGQDLPAHGSSWQHSSSAGARCPSTRRTAR